MRGTSIFALAMLASVPASAESPITDSERAALDEAEVRLGVNAFFAALRSEDKTALARTMIPEAVIFVHDRRDPENPITIVRPVSEHLENWERTPPGTDEYMTYESVLIDGSMAHVWGPYIFLIDGKPTHCGINSMSLNKTPDGWRVSNTSFTVTSLHECDKLGAPEVPE